MELKQYAAEHIIENGKHYPEKWVNRYFIEVADAKRALDAERAKVKELEETVEIHAKSGCQPPSVVQDLRAHLTQLQALVRTLIYSDNAPEHDRAWFALRATLDATPTATPTHNGGA